jgi:hypothetical protein
MFWHALALLFFANLLRLLISYSACYFSACYLALGEEAFTIEESTILARINSEGVDLKLACFPRTLMSEFWDEDRGASEKFNRKLTQPLKAGSKPSPFNHLIHLDPRASYYKFR